MIEGITHTPTQAESHEVLQARNGWTVAAMRDQINALIKDNQRLSVENEALKKEIYQVRNHWSQYNNAFFLRVRNALAYLRLVNTSNVDQAYINCAKLELEDIDKRRSSK